MIITSEGDATAGENYTLSCTITIIDGLVGATVSTDWTDSRGNPAEHDATQASPLNTTLTLEFDPLLLSHGGQYFCNASISISAISAVTSNSEPYDIIVQSECSVVNMHVGALEVSNACISATQTSYGSRHEYQYL
jgi:hypothetical protein